MRLSLYGPGGDVALREYGFPKPRDFSFLEIFSLHVSSIGLDSEGFPEDFVSWVTSECSGEDSRIPEVGFGYQLAHYFFECNDMDIALDCLKEGIKNFFPKSKEVADVIWAEIE